MKTIFPQKLYGKDFIFRKHHQSSNSLLTTQEQLESVQIKLINKVFVSKQHLNDLNAQNEQISNFKLQVVYNTRRLKYYSRSKSSESKEEGSLTRRAQQVFTQIPYHCCKMIKKQYIKKLWRKYIFVIISLFRYEKARYDIYKFYIPKRKLCIIPTPETLAKYHRKRNQESLTKLSTFGEYIEAQDLLEQKSKRKEEPDFKKSPIYQKYKCNDLRISRILKKNPSIIPVVEKLSPRNMKTAIISVSKLPPLRKLDRRMKRFFSNQAKG